MTRVDSRWEIMITVRPTAFAAAAEGGRVVLPKVDNGWVKKAQIADPAGNVLTLIQG